MELTKDALEELSALVVSILPAPEPAGVLAPDPPEQLLEPLGIALSREAELWFSWDWAVKEVAPHCQLMPLASAVYQTVACRKSAEDTSAWVDRLHEPSEFFPDTWLMFGYSGGASDLVIDCRDANTSPVIYYRSEFALEPDAQQPVFGSLGEFVQTWSAGLRAGGAHHNGLRWVVTDEDLARRMRLSAG